MYSRVKMYGTTSCIFESFGSDRLARPCVDVGWWRAQQKVDTQHLERDATLGG